jgi:hypothetical protein
VNGNLRKDLEVRSWIFYRWVDGARGQYQGLACQAEKKPEQVLGLKWHGPHWELQAAIRWLEGRRQGRTLREQALERLAKLILEAGPDCTCFSWWTTQWNLHSASSVKDRSEEDIDDWKPIRRSLCSLAGRECSFSLKEGRRAGSYRGWGEDWD